MSNTIIESNETMDVRGVFIVNHSRQLPNGHEDVKLIGVYASPARAQEAIDRTRLIEGFRDYPGGFTVDQYVIDRDHWQEGFARRQALAYSQDGRWHTLTIQVRDRFPSEQARSRGPAQAIRHRRLAAAHRLTQLAPAVIPPTRCSLSKSLIFLTLSLSCATPRSTPPLLWKKGAGWRWIRLVSSRPESSARSFRSIADTSPAMADSIPLEYQSVRHRTGGVSVMPPECRPPSPPESCPSWVAARTGRAYLGTRPLKKKVSSA